MVFFIQCEVVPEKAPTQVSTMADIISKDAQQQQQQVDDNKTKMPEIKPPQIVTLLPGSQTKKGFGTSSSQQRVTTTSGSGKTAPIRVKRITVLTEEIVGFHGLLFRKIDVSVSALPDEREDDDLDDDYAEDEEEGDLDTGIENEWMNKILEKTPQLQGNRKN
ncbi:MAG: hypothetical protein EZS28_054097, partial [Streblomastix strix]